MIFDILARVLALTTVTRTPFGTLASSGDNLSTYEGAITYTSVPPEFDVYVNLSLNQKVSKHCEPSCRIQFEYSGTGCPAASAYYNVTREQHFHLSSTRN